MRNRRSDRPSRSLSSRVAAGLVALFVTSVPGPILAEDNARQVQGLFCNTERQIDETIGRILQGLTPRVAVEFTNERGVVCTFVDRLHYLIDGPSLLRETPGLGSLLKYEGILVGVIVGGALRPVAPPVRIFFATPERLAGVSREEPA